MAPAIFPKIEQERAALGLPTPKVALAGKYRGAKIPLPVAQKINVKP